jgi:hypothetical protein
MGPNQQGFPATLVCTQAQKGRTTVRAFGVQERWCKNKFSAVGLDQPRKELELCIPKEV